MRMLRLVNQTPIAQQSKLMIGDQIIPFYSATVSLRVGFENVITLTAPLEAIDIVALERNTKIHVVRDDQIEDSQKPKEDEP